MMVKVGMRFQEVTGEQNNGGLTSVALFVSLGL